VARERLSAAAWQGLAHSFAVFLAWAAAVARSAALKEAVSSTGSGGAAIETGLLHCIFSAWRQVGRRGRVAFASHAKSVRAQP